MLTITSACSKACFTASPAIRPPWPMKCGLSEGMTPSAICVGTAGAFSRCASSRTSGAAPAAITPPPATTSGRFARAAVPRPRHRIGAGRGRIKAR
jgi:hypothetical protein